MNMKDFGSLGDLIYVPTAAEINAEVSDGKGLPFVKIPKEDAIVVRLLMPVNKDGDPSGPRPKHIFVRRVHWVPSEDGKSMPVSCLGRECPICALHDLAIEKLCGGDKRGQYRLPSSKYGLKAKWGVIANVMTAKPSRTAESYNDFEWHGPALMEFGWTLWGQIFGNDKDESSRVSCLNAKSGDVLFHPVEGCAFTVMKAQPPVHFRTEIISHPDGRRMHGPAAATVDELRDIIQNKVIDLDLLDDTAPAEVYEYAVAKVEAEIYAVVAEAEGLMNDEDDEILVRPSAARTSPVTKSARLPRAQAPVIDIASEEPPSARVSRKESFVADDDFDDADFG